MTINEMRKLKDEYGFSIAALADYTKVPVGTLVKIFSGETSKPREATLKALNEFFTRVAVTSAIKYTDVMTPADSLMVRQEVAGYGLKQNEGYTIADIEAFPEERRCELINGVIYDMAPASVPHNMIADYVGEKFKEYIKKNGGDCYVSTGQSGMFPVDDDRTFLIPDVMVTCDPKKITKKGICGAPDFVLEVSSPSNYKYDVQLKFSVYMTIGVREYWVIDAENAKFAKYVYEGNAYTKLGGLNEVLDVDIYDGELQIDLREIQAIIDKFND